MKNFNHLGIMIDCSRNGVMNVAALKKMILLLEKMGYNTLMLYMEDVYEIKSQPYFGHLIGKYSQEELREIDKFASEHNIELIPCIQTLAHLRRMARWRKFSDLFDLNDILCVGEDNVYELIDEMFSSISNSFTSKVVNIGMDEAWLLGHGKYMDKHGLEDKCEILLKHLNAVSEIGKKYDFELCMWSDMFFRIANGGDYYGTGEVSSSVKEKIPENVRLIYWDYYSKDKGNYDMHIEAHHKIADDIWFGGGIWTWTGFAPHNTFSLESCKVAVKSCLEHNVKDVFFCLWGDDGNETSRFSILPSLYAAAQYSNGIFDLETIKQGFEELFGIGFDDFMLVDLPYTQNTEGEWKNPDKYLLYNDCLLGKYDCTIPEGLNERYKINSEKLANLCSNKEYGTIFNTLKCLCDVLAFKAEIGVKTRKAYLANDYVKLHNLLGEYDEIVNRLAPFYEAVQKQWMEENKPQGFEIQDVRIGGLIQRVKHVKTRIEKYLNKEISEIEELEEPVLDISGNGLEINQMPIQVISWSDMVSAANLL